jgi:hypothetical protein
MLGQAYPQRMIECSRVVTIVDVLPQKQLGTDYRHIEQHRATA